MLSFDCSSSRMQLVRIRCIQGNTHSMRAVSVAPRSSTSLPRHATSASLTKSSSLIAAVIVGRHASSSARPLAILGRCFCMTHVWTLVHPHAHLYTHSKCMKADVRCQGVSQENATAQANANVQTAHLEHLWAESCTYSPYDQLMTMPAQFRNCNTGSSSTVNPEMYRHDICTWHKSCTYPGRVV